MGKLKSPKIYIAHTNNNPNNEYHGLTKFDEMRAELEATFFHTPKFHYQRLIRGGLSCKISDLLYSTNIKAFSEHLILSTRKSVFFGGIR